MGLYKCSVMKQTFTNQELKTVILKALGQYKLTPEEVLKQIEIVSEETNWVTCIKYYFDVHVNYHANFKWDKIERSVEGLTEDGKTIIKTTRTPQYDSFDTSSDIKEARYIHLTKEDIKNSCSYDEDFFEDKANDKKISFTEQEVELNDEDIKQPEELRTYLDDAVNNVACSGDNYLINKKINEEVFSLVRYQVLRLVIKYKNQLYEYKMIANKNCKIEYNELIMPDLIRKKPHLDHYKFFKPISFCISLLFLIAAVAITVFLFLPELTYFWLVGTVIFTILFLVFFIRAMPKKGKVYAPIAETFIKNALDDFISASSIKPSNAKKIVKPKDDHKIISSLKPIEDTKKAASEEQIKTPKD